METERSPEEIALLATASIVQRGLAKLERLGLDADTKAQFAPERFAADGYSGLVEWLAALERASPGETVPAGGPSLPQTPHELSLHASVLLLDALERIEEALKHATTALATLPRSEDRAAAKRAVQRLHKLSMAASDIFPLLTSPSQRELLRDKVAGVPSDHARFKEAALRWLNLSAPLWLEDRESRRGRHNSGTKVE